MILEKLIKIAAFLDSRGFYAFADQIDKIADQVNRDAKLQQIKNDLARGLSFLKPTKYWPDPKTFLNCVIAKNDQGRAVQEIFDMVERRKLSEIEYLTLVNKYVGNLRYKFEEMMNDERYLK